MRTLAVLTIGLLWPIHHVLGEAGAGGTINVVTLVSQVGLSGVFLWQWAQANKERREADARWQTFAEKALPVMADVAKTLSAVQQGFSTTVDKAAAVPSRSDLDLAVRRNELVTDQLAAVAKALSGTLDEMTRVRTERPETRS